MNYSVLTLWTFSARPIYMTNFCGKFHWYSSTEWRDIASRKIGVNRRMDGRTTEKHNDSIRGSVACCWMKHKKKRTSGYSKSRALGDGWCQQADDAGSRQNQQRFHSNSRPVHHDLDLLSKGQGSERTRSVSAPKAAVTCEIWTFFSEVFQPSSNAVIGCDRRDSQIFSNICLITLKAFEL